MTFVHHAESVGMEVVAICDARHLFGEIEGRPKGLDEQLALGREVMPHQSWIDASLARDSPHGASLVAVAGGIFRQPDPAAEFRKWLAALR